MAHRALLVPLLAALSLWSAPPLLAAAPKAAAKPAAAVKAKAPAAAAAPAGKFQAFPFPTETRTLKNGLRVVLVPYDSPGLVAFYVLMRVGSRNEAEKGRSGYAHFFEHMMFRGTKAHPSDDYNSTMSRLGLDSNASTWDDMTIYQLYGPSRSLPTVLEYEGDRFQNLEFTVDQVKTEAGAILGEYAKNASAPETLLFEKMSETAFTRHTYQHTVIGYLADIKAMPEGTDYAREFFKRYYTPDNATVIISGDFDKAKTLALVEKSFGGWKGKLRAAPIAVEPPQKQARRASVEWGSPTLPRLWTAWHVPGSADLKSTAAALVLNGYLFGPTSPLYQDLLLGRQLVDSLDATFNVERDPTLFGVLLRVKKQDDVAEVEKAITAGVQQLAKGKIDAARLRDVVSNARYSAALHLDKADALADTLAHFTSPTGDLNFLNKLYAQLERLNGADLTAFARKWLVETNRTTVTLSTKKEVAK